MITKEDIQAASEKFSGRFFFGTDKDILDSEYCSRCGANWRIDVAWRAANVIPEKGRQLLVEDKFGSLVLDYNMDDDCWKDKVKELGYVKFAYSDDLMQNKPE